MQLNNLEYFNIAQNNPEPSRNDNYSILNWDKYIGNYVSTTKTMKEHFATIKILTENGDDASKYYTNLYELSKTEFASKNEFNCFVNACDATQKILEKDFELFKEVVDLYLEHRDFTEITPKEWVQALIDKGASRSLGKVGEDKLVKIAENSGFVFVKNWNDLNNNKKVVAKFSKGIFNIKSFEQKLGIKLNFGNQSKMLDIILKSGNNFAFIEAKHLKEDGGSQNKQITELIAIIKEKPNKENVYYCAFVDGYYSNVILGSTKNNQKSDNKLTTQQEEIVKILNNNQTSFWFNTTGFEKFVEDFGKIE